MNYSKRNIILSLISILFLFFPKTSKISASNIPTPKTTTKKVVKEQPLGLSIDTEILLSRWNTKTYLMPGAPFEDKGNHLFTDQEYIDHLQLIPTVFEMPFNELVKDFITEYTVNHRKSVAYMLGTSNFYIPIFEEVLAKYNLPLELKYLPFVESALDPYARDTKGNVGLWLWNITKAKSYGLTENSLVDDRLDIYKATDAAVKRLGNLYKKYNNWGLTLAAYNCGETEIEKAITKAKGSKDFWQIYPYLPKTDRTYYPAFIAFNYVVNNYQNHGITPMKVVLPEITDSIHISQNLYMEQVAALCNISIDEIRALNPQYLTNLIPGSTQTCVLTLPLRSIYDFLKLNKNVYTYKVNSFKTKRSVVKVAKAPTPIKKKPTTLYIRVKSGQSLSVIASRYHTTVSQLRYLNHKHNNNIRAGESLRVR